MANASKIARTGVKEETAGIIFAASISQEFLSMVTNAVKNNSVRHNLLPDAYKFGTFVFYAEFDSTEQKAKFLKDTSLVYFTEVWAS